MKLIFDFTSAFIALVILAPLLLVLFILVRIFLGKPAFFKQMRPGFKGKSFIFYKFRTMTNATDHHGNFLPDEARMHPFGAFLRKTSLDELPQLLNVIKGDISLVGPRPLLMEYLPLYNEEQMRRHDVKPGITGWAQVNGRNAISWDEKFKYDVWYVDNQSFWLDMKILLLTVKKVLIREGVNSQGVVTMRKFTGNTSEGLK